MGAVRAWGGELSTCAANGSAGVGSTTEGGGWGNSAASVAGEGSGVVVPVGAAASVAMRGRGVRFCGAGGAGPAAGGGTQRVCSGPVRTVSSAGKRRSSEPDTLSSATACATSTVSTKAAKVRREGGPDKAALSPAGGWPSLPSIKHTSPDRPTVAGQTGASFGQSARPIRCRGWRTNPGPPRPAPSARLNQRPGRKNPKCRATTH